MQKFNIFVNIKGLMMMTFCKAVSMKEERSLTICNLSRMGRTNSVLEIEKQS